MRFAHVSRIDLNLLVVLYALLETGSVTSAATQLRVTQSAVSRSLARLREVFDDQLFVRRGRGVVPTPLASELAAPLRARLAELDSLIGDRGTFDPKTSRRRFRIVAFDYPQIAVLAPLVRRLAEIAPGIDLEIRQPSRANDDELERGGIDILLAPKHGAGAAIVWSAVFSDDYVCMLAAENRKPLTGAAFATMSHVLVAPREQPGAVVDEVLARTQKLQRRVAVQVPTFLVLPQVLVGTPYVATVPARLARAFCEHYPLRVVKPPITIPGFTIYQAWHELHRHDAGHRWLRDAITSMAPSRPVRSTT